MIRNYFIIAWRNLLKQKVVSVIFIQLAPGSDRQQFEAGLQPFNNSQFEHIII